MMLWMMSYFIFAGGMLLQLVEAVNLFIGAEERKKRIMGKKLALLFGMLTMVILLCGLLCREGTAKPQLYYVYGDRL